MEDQEAIATLKSLLETGKLDAKETQAVTVAFRTLSLMVSTSDGYLRQLKTKKDRARGFD